MRPLVDAALASGLDVDGSVADIGPGGGPLADEDHDVRAGEEVGPATPQDALAGDRDELTPDPVASDEAALQVQPVEVERPPLVGLGGGIEFPAAHGGEEPAELLEVRGLSGAPGPVVDDSDEDALGIRIVHSHRITSSSGL